MKTNKFVFGALAGAVSLAVTLPAFAEVKTGDFGGIDKLSLEEFVATVVVTVGTSDTVSVSVDDRNGNKEPVLFEKSGSTLRVYSKTGPDRKNFWRNLSWQRDGSDAFRNFLVDYPVVQVTLPAGTAISAEALAAYVTIGDTNGDLDVGSTIYMEGTVGNLANADIKISGAGDLMLASVSNQMKGDIAGSGSLSFDTVGSADIGIAGSGDIVIKRILGATEVDIRGSGDVDLGNIGGDADLDIAGSGDIVTGIVDGGLKVTIRGSGDIEVGSVNGPTAVDINGNGDVSIKDGTATGMSVSITGSGDLDFNGVAHDPEVSVRGSGDIFIRDYVGKVRTNGSGDITIGDIHIDD